MVYSIKFHLKAFDFVIFPSAVTLKVNYSKIKESSVFLKTKSFYYRMIKKNLFSNLEG